MINLQQNMNNTLSPTQLSTILGEAVSAGDVVEVERPGEIGDVAAAGLGGPGGSVSVKRSVWRREERRAYRG